MRFFLLAGLLCSHLFAQGVKVEMTHQEKDGKHFDYSTGVVLDSGLILTTAHNIEGEEHVFVWADGNMLLTETVKANKDTDLALLKVIADIDWHKKLRVKLAENDAVKDDKVLLSGCPKGLDVRPMLGKIKDAEKCIAKFDDFDEGCSGSCILCDGKLCGMATGYIKGDKKSAVYVPVSVIKKFLEEKK